MNSPQLLVWANIPLYVDLHFWCGPTFRCMWTCISGVGRHSIAGLHRPSVLVETHTYPCQLPGALFLG